MTIITYSDLLDAIDNVRETTLYPDVMVASQKLIDDLASMMNWCGVNRRISGQLTSGVNTAKRRGQLKRARAILRDRNIKTVVADVENWL